MRMSVTDFLWHQVLLIYIGMNISLEKLERRVFLTQLNSHTCFKHGFSSLITMLSEERNPKLLIILYQSINVFSLSKKANKISPVWSPGIFLSS